MKTISKHILLPLFAILLLTTSCKEENIDLVPLSITEASYYKEEIDFDRSVLGIYSKLTDLYWFNVNEPIHGFWLLPGDDITTIGTEAFEIFGTLQSADSKINNYYRTCYQLINRANITLEKIDEEKGIYVTPNLKDHHRGEALFLRGLMYFNLSNYFGTSPLILKRVQSTEEITQPNATEGSLLDQAISDFQAAAALLPAGWDNANRGRATVNSANGYLGKALVYRASMKKVDADYLSAIAAFDKIKGVSLMPDFASNFNAEEENNAESLFEFQASQPGGWDNVWLNNDFNNNDGAMSAYWGFYENHWSLFGAAPYLGSKKLLAAFDPADPRLPVTMDATTRAITKYVAKDIKSSSGVGSLNNPRLLRYADILLLKAEAIIMSNGKLADAVQLINQVRSRARKMKPNGVVPMDYATTQTDKNTVMEWVANERFIEFAGEEGFRWLDLRRWHMNGRIDLSKWNFSSDRSDVKISVPKNLYYPIPLNEVDLNPNVKQNPGY
ncbi:RagB/SusD family nutrient uptake outer membrane protein [Dyadobacter sp. CY347]|uniref:RagB/SusD family nutrient uptake outer membrane protein n=1 Tax=Dyadobacter sp. CY347 TaxID=2909336 RepID=UPI001F1A3702|nr:RagB/SusD family nutrient uptake outer membrane protein [Dyadobacter sp. CY347]MCF2491604.1 RagB/SusD family nutrient uptake outer membrane protein [Dyadobacter sp. CY347]